MYSSCEPRRRSRQSRFTARRIECLRRHAADVGAGQLGRRRRRVDPRAIFTISPSKPAATRCRLRPQTAATRRASAGVGPAASAATADTRARRARRRARRGGGGGPPPAPPPSLSSGAGGGTTAPLKSGTPSPETANVSRSGTSPSPACARSAPATGRPTAWRSAAAYARALLVLRGVVVDVAELDQQQRQQTAAPRRSACATAAATARSATARGGERAIEDLERLVEQRAAGAVVDAVAEEVAAGDDERGELVVGRLRERRLDVRALGVERGEVRRSPCIVRGRRCPSASARSAIPSCAATSGCATIAEDRLRRLAQLVAAEDADEVVEAVALSPRRGPRGSDDHGTPRRAPQRLVASRRPEASASARDRHRIAAETPRRSIGAARGSARARGGGVTPTGRP